MLTPRTRSGQQRRTEHQRAGRRRCVLTCHLAGRAERVFASLVGLGAVTPPEKMQVDPDDRLHVLLDDLRHEIKRLNENLEEFDGDQEVTFPDEFR